MKIVTWNINGIRTFKDGIKKTLDSFNADIICVQETKVTRDLLDERTAIVDGYNSYFSFSQGRSGYSGVATFCKDTATPFAAEEGLTGRLVNHAESVGCCNDVGEFTSEELQALDSEGRAVITQHRIKLAEKSETLTVINVYCPRADPEKPERKLFKLQFYKLLQTRAEMILGSQSHVIILGDINTSHRPIDHCDPDDVDNFEDNPGRKWLDGLLCESNQDGEAQDSERSPNCVSGGQFVDSFRYFHPTRTNAFTCWSSRTGARQTNYGTRIDYIFADSSLAKKSFLDADIMPEVEGSDHCPMWAQLSCSLKPSPRCPALCTRYLPEFIGKQQKLLRFLVKVSDQKINPNGTEKPLPGSQEDGEVRENLRPQLSGVSSGQKRPANGIPESSNVKGKKNKQDKKTAPKPQGSLLNFFKPKLSHVTSGQGSTVFTDNGSSSKDSMSEVYEDTQNTFTDGTSTVTIPTECHIEVKSEINNLNIKNTTKMNQDQTTGNATINKQTAKASCPDFWKSVLHGPPQPPLCKGHNEPCVLRTVKKAGPNMGRQFFVCCRPEGHASNPDARCNFFAWVDKRK